MFTQKHTSEALLSALELIRDECRSHPESCTECPLSFSDGGPIRQCGITDRFFTPVGMGYFAGGALAGVRG